MASSAQEQLIINYAQIKGASDSACEILFTGTNSDYEKIVAISDNSSREEIPTVQHEEAEMEFSPQIEQPEEIPEPSLNLTSHRSLCMSKVASQRYLRSRESAIDLDN